MSTTTPKLGLIKPDGGDYVDVNDLNANFDRIDNMTANDVGALPISGGTLTGNTTIQTNSSPLIQMLVTNTTKRALLTKNATSSIDYGTKVTDELDSNNKTALILNSGSSQNAKARLELTVGGNSTQYNIYGEHNKPTASDVGALPIGGGTLTDVLQIHTPSYPNIKLIAGNGSATSCSVIEGSPDSDGAITLWNYDNKNDGSNRRGLALGNATRTGLHDAIRLRTLVNGTSTNYMLFGEHNKPLGTYVGNGSTTERRINTGGRGRVVMITAPSQGGVSYSTIITANGGVSWNNQNTTSATVKGFGGGAVYWSYDSIYLHSNAPELNANGVTYTYQVL